MKAHELVACLPTDDPHYREVMAAVKFDLGEFGAVEEMSRVSTWKSFEVPAPLCLFEFQEYGSIFWCLAKSIPERDGTAWMMFYSVGSGHVAISEIQCFVCRNGDAIVAVGNNQSHKIVQPGDLNDADRSEQKMLMSVAASIEVFSCCNVAQIEHKAPKFINAKRIAKGKVPFFTYRTLHITSDSAPKSGEVAKGTHASPRLHLRRGHIRRLPDERRIWVRASLVGDKSKGFAAKDYKVVA